MAWQGYLAGRRHQGTQIPEAAVVHACPLHRWDTGTIFLDAVHPAPDLRPGSAFFQQAAAVGLGHTAALRHVLARACMRLGLPFEIPPPFAESVDLTLFAKLPPPRVRCLPACPHALRVGYLSSCFVVMLMKITSVPAAKG